MSTLIISLPAALPHGASQLAYALSADGRSPGRQSESAVPLLPGHSAAERVALVPASALSWHRVQLPRGTLGRRAWTDGQSPRLRAVLEGLLEEKLLDEPAQLHFALAPLARDDTPVWVAVCDRAWLRAWLALLEQHQCPVTRIVPEFAPLPGPEVSGANAGVVVGQLQIVGTSGQGQIIWSTPGRLAVLPLVAGSVALIDWPASAPIWAEPAVAALAEDLFKRPVNLQHSGDRWLQASLGDWDLTQFELANSGRTRRWRQWQRWADGLLRAPRWRAARWAAAALVLAHVVGLNAWAWSERQSLAARQQAVRQVLTQTFPGVKTVIDAPVQMARELALLRRQAGGASVGDFEPMMAAFGSLALANSASTAIEYVANELRIKGLSTTPAQITEAAQALRTKGLSVRAEGDTLLIQVGVAP